MKKKIQNSKEKSYNRPMRTVLNQGGGVKLREHYCSSAPPGPTAKYSMCPEN